MKRLIIFLVRKRLGLKKYEKFQFRNQKSPRYFYYFTKEKLMKMDARTGEIIPSSVSINWLLDDDCELWKGVGEFGLFTWGEVTKA